MKSKKVKKILLIALTLSLIHIYPEAGIDLFLEKLVQETEKEHEDILKQADETDAMFGELYSWYPVSYTHLDVYKRQGGR